MNGLTSAGEGGLPDAEAFARKLEEIASHRDRITPHSLREVAAMIRRLATTGQPGSSAQGEAVHVLRIPRSKSLDPITVYVEDVAPGAGRATIVCYNQAWTCYWGAMGSRTLLQFIAGCDEHYVSGNMLCGRWLTDDEERNETEREYVARVALAVITEAKAVATTPPPAPAADHIADAGKKVQPEARGVVLGRLPAPITNPEAWPPNYASGWNDCASIALDEMTSALAAAPEPMGVDEAEAFEAWARPHFPGAEVFDRIEGRPGGWEYNGNAVQSAWAVWRARAALKPGATA